MAERNRPSLDVTCAAQAEVASTTLKKAGLLEQSDLEPGRWQDSPLVVATGSPVSSESEVPGPRSGIQSGTHASPLTAAQVRVQPTGSAL